MNPELNKCKRIKLLIENASGVQNIGERSRKRPYPELKKIYSKLCNEFTFAPLEIIGEVLGNYNHATIIYSINTFEDLADNNGLDFLEVYKIVFNQIQQERKDVHEFQTKKKVPPTASEVNQKFRISLIKIIEKSHSIINKQKLRIEELEKLLEIKNQN